MNKYFFCFALILVFLLTGCHITSKEDKIKLAKLENKYGDRYHFNLTIDGIYLEAKLKKGANLEELDGENIFATFHEDEMKKFHEQMAEYIRTGKKNKQINCPDGYILNLYDSSGYWLYQVVYAYPENRLERSRLQEHY